MTDKNRPRPPRRTDRSEAEPRPRPDRPPAWRIEELARRARVPVRTVRYYLSRGLLPAPAFRGPNTTYGAEHLARLEAIQRLQSDYLPLDAIARALEGSSLEELGRLAREGLRELPRPDAAAAARQVLIEIIPSPAPRRRSAPSATPPSRVVRWRLAPGLELLLDEEAPAASRRLAEHLRTSVAPETGKGDAS